MTKELFEEVLSYHGWLTQRIFKSLVREGLDKSSVIEIIPEKFITIGIFGKMNEQHSVRALRV